MSVSMQGKRKMEEQTGQSLIHYSFLFAAFFGIKKILSKDRGCGGMSRRRMCFLPVFTAQSLFISIGDPSKLLLPLLLLLLVLLRQSPLEVLYHSVFLLLRPVTLALLAQKENCKSVPACNNILRCERMIVQMWNKA